MPDKEYQDKKRECWENFKFARRPLNTDKKVFDYIFDRAYTLGKQTEAIMCEDVEKAAEEYAEKAMEHVYSGEWDSEYVQGLIEAAWYDGYTALGKQENDANTVISGWVCRDKKDNALNLHAEKPYRAQSGYDVSDEPDWWESDCASFLPLDKNLFPDLTWESDPQPVEIIIKRKKNG